ncbi:MAG: BON domain-containing protein [Verrucomicrobiaceae bacterium]|nr:MAG: BON domain-containing protein [Verrucomicrobiaceae bacterium]
MVAASTCIRYGEQRQDGCRGNNPLVSSDQGRRSALWHHSCKEGRKKHPTSDVPNHPRNQIMKPKTVLQKRRRWAALAAAAFGSILPAMATPQMEPESADETISFIQTDINADSRMKGTDVKIRMEDGVAILTGEVSSLAQAERATARAVANKSVRAVVNQVAVRKGPESGPLAVKIKSALREQKMFHANDVMVTVTGSRVTLAGSVGVWDEKDLAREVVSEVPGVTAIENKVAVTDEGIREDAQITSQLRHMIQDDPLYDGLDLAVSVRDGTASLTGEVGSRGEFDRLVRRSYVTGVMDVNIVGLGIDGSLVMEGLGDKNPAPDEALASLKQALAKDSRIPGGTVDATLKDGVAMLKGDVGGIAESDAAEATARAIPGVLRVSNELKVSSNYAAADRKVDFKAASAPLVKPDHR